jgi:hypothetical protein
VSGDGDRRSPWSGPELVAREDRYRMRRLTDDEMTMLIRLARDGRTGPGRAMVALWDLILRDAEGINYEDAAATDRLFAVQNYAIASDQARALHDAMMKGRRLPRREVTGFGWLWLNLSPAEYDVDEPGD